MATSPPADALEARLAHLRETDAEAFMEVLFKEFYRPLGNVIQRVVHDRDATEDLLQDVFLRIWNGRATLVISTTYRAYLYRAALNAALRYQERGQRQVAWDDAPPAAEPRTDDALHALYQQEAEDSVEAALARLPPQCRVVFTMSRYDEMSYQQIAETLDISPKTVENQMGKALRIMRQQLSGLLKNLYSFLL
ncbi:RNA polymerase sigma-70 factor [Hymenobacter aquaticus]|uniref:RNA polymerase sigma-70 factor n=1 Tax=Hymenobacter aquaticus TaxID=1867101 RepID=A0A4Z0PV67_9BACT|nr:RNA polymerase sigma-70 factor [Hymenobacter aquaticus]TGE20302.1 RNA polymerase sigma-70 factor [Hymenobacter aquaticus]